MSGFLTTHVLDAARGCPAAGMKIELYRVDGADRTLLRTVTTNADGRTDSHILPAAEFATGIYELLFFAGDYLDGCGLDLAEPKFLGQIPLRFGMSEASHYHVPLLLSPYSFSTYRGS